MSDVERARAQIKRLIGEFLQEPSDEMHDRAIKLERRYAGLHAANDHVGGVPQAVLDAIGALERIYQPEEYENNRKVLSDLYEKL